MIFKIKKTLPHESFRVVDKNKPTATAVGFIFGSET